MLWIDYSYAINWHIVYKKFKQFVYMHANLRF